MSHIHGLAAILVAGHRRDDLGHNRTGHLKALGALDHLLVHHSAVIQHVRDIDETAVKDRLNKVIRVMEMNRSLFMGHGNAFRQKHTLRQIPGYLSGDVIPLCGCQNRILIGIFLRQLLVFIPDQLQDRFIRRVRFSQKRPLIPVNHIFFRESVLVLLNQAALNHILNALDMDNILTFFLHIIQNSVNQCLPGAFRRVHFRIRLLNSPYNLLSVIIYNSAVTFLYLNHRCLLISFNPYSTL